MMLAVDLHNGGSIGIVGPTVFALGADDHYIVVKQHPAKDSFGNFDHTVTHYFIVTRISGTAEENEKVVHGPLSKDEFDRLAVHQNVQRPRVISQGRHRQQAAHPVAQRINRLTMKRSFATRGKLLLIVK
jgi:hypothetical protein